MGFLKDIFVDIVGTAKSLGADFVNVATPWDDKEPGGRIRTVSFGGREFKTPSYRAERAGQLWRVGEKKEAGGELLWAGLDIISVLPAGKVVGMGVKGAKAIKTGAKVGAKRRLGREAVKTGAISGAYGAGYGASEAMQQGASGSEIASSAFRGGAVGFTAGLGFGVAASVLGKQIGKTLYGSSTKVAKETNPKKIAKIFEKDGATKVESQKLANIFTKIDDEGAAYNSILSTKAFRAVEVLTKQDPTPQIKAKMSEAISQFTKHSDDLLEHQVMTARLVDNVVEGAVKSDPKIMSHYKGIVDELQKVSQKRVSNLEAKQFKISEKLKIPEKGRRKFLKETVLDFYKRKEVDKWQTKAKKYKKKKNFLKTAKEKFPKKKKSELLEAWRNRKLRPNKHEKNRKVITRKIHQYAKSQLPGKEADKILARLKSSEATTIKGFSRIIDDIGTGKVKVRKAKIVARKNKLIKTIKERYLKSEDKKRAVPFKRMPEKIAAKVDNLKKQLNVLSKSQVDKRLKIAKKIKAIIQPMEASYKKAKKIRGAVTASEKVALKKGVSNNTIIRAREIFGLEKEGFYEKAIGGKDFSAKAKEVKTFLSKLKEGDTLYTKENIKAMTTKGGYGESVMAIPKKELTRMTLRELNQKYKLNEVLGVEGGRMTKFRKAMTQVVNMKKRLPILKRFLNSIQGDEAVFTKKMLSETEKLDNIHKEWKKAIPRKDRRVSSEKIFKAWEGKKRTLNEAEKKALDYFKSYMKNSEEYLKKVKPDFKSRKDYAPHIRKKLNEHVKEHGWRKGTRKFLDDKKMIQTLNGEKNALIFLHNNVSDEFKAGFLKKRTGKLDHSLDPFNAFDAYMGEFERTKYMDKILPKFTALKKITSEADGLHAWIETHKANIKGKAKNDLENILMRVADFNYMTKLSVSPISAMKNMWGGNVNNIIENGVARWTLGGQRLTTSPRKALKFFEKNGLDIGDYTEAGKNIPIANKLLKKGRDTMFLNQRLAEKQIRLQQVMGQISSNEWKKFKKDGKLLSNKRVVEVLDNLEKTQGLYTSSRTAHGFQTAPGKLVSTFQRWKFIDAAMMSNNIKDAAKLFKGGNKKEGRKALAKIARAVAFYYMSAKMAKELAEAGYDKMAKIMETGKEPVDVMKNPDAWLPMITEGANVDVIKQTINTARAASYELGLSKRPYRYEDMDTLKDAYFSPIAALEDVGLLQPKRPKALGKYIYKLPKTQQKKELYKIKKLQPEIYKGVLRYYKWNKIGLLDDEQEIYYIRDNDDKIKTATKYLKKLPFDERKEALQRLRIAKAFSKKQLRAIVKQL